MTEASNLRFIIQCRDKQIAALRRTIDCSPILSQYHGHQGFEVERFVVDYETWRVAARGMFTEKKS